MYWKSINLISYFLMLDFEKLLNLSNKKFRYVETHHQFHHGNIWQKPYISFRAWNGFRSASIVVLIMNISCEIMSNVTSDGSCCKLLQYRREQHSQWKFTSKDKTPVCHSQCHICWYCGVLCNHLVRREHSVAYTRKIKYDGLPK